MTDSVSSNSHHISSEGLSSSHPASSESPLEAAKSTEVKSPLKANLSKIPAKLRKAGGRVVESLPELKSNIIILKNAFKSSNNNSFPNGDESQALLLLSECYKKLKHHFGSNKTDTTPMAPKPARNSADLDTIAFGRMEELAEESGVSRDELKAYIASGREIASKLGDLNTLTPQQYSKEGARDVIWYMMYMSATRDEQHTSGMFRIDDNNKNLFHFINTCDKSPGSYGRISTHYGAHAEHTKELTGGKQRGLDMGDLKLPGDKHTILFSTLPDGTTFVKLEEHGFPPFWKKSHMGFKSLSQSVGHSVDLVEHLAGVKKKNTYAARRENTSKADLQLFTSCMSTLKEMYSELSKIDPQGINEKEKIQKREEKGIKYGITQMHKSLTKQIADVKVQIEIAKSNNHDTTELEDKLNQLNESLAPLEDRIARDKAIGYEGHRQGNEVCLPSFQVFQKNN